MTDDKKMTELPCLSSEGIYLFWSEVDDESCKAASEFILQHNYNQSKRPHHLSFLINSNGGSLFSAFGLTEIMQGSKIPIYTWGTGLIASCGLLIFITGEKNHRYITPNTSILSHQYSWVSFGKHHDLLATRKQEDLTHERIMKHYKKHTGLDEKTIREKLLPESDVWLSAEEALELNLADAIKMNG